MEFLLGFPLVGVGFGLSAIFARELVRFCKATLERAGSSRADAFDSPGFVTYFRRLGIVGAAGCATGAIISLVALMAD